MTDRHRCQACHAQNSSVQSYQIGDEQSITLCADCAEQVKVSPQQDGAEGEHAEDEQDYPDWSFGQKASFFLPTALLTMGLPALLHAPLPAEVFGLVGALLLAAKSPQLYADLREELPAPVVDWLDGAAERRRRHAQTGQWSTWDRLLGRHWQQDADEQEDDVPLGLAAPEQQHVLDQQEQATAASQQHEQTRPWVPPQFGVDQVLDVVQTFTKKGCLYFGNSEQGAIALPVKSMYHVLDVSSSGKGKSNRFRLAMLQLVEQCETYCINPLAANVKPVTDEREIEVWKPLYDRLANKRPIKEGQEIKHLLSALLSEIGRRNAQEEQYDFSWQDQPVFVFIDELPEVVARCPEALKLLDSIGRMGRQYGLFLWVASQTANVNDIGLSTSAQAQFKTRIYGGGDKPSADRLMKGALSKQTERLLQTSGAGLTVMLADGLDGLAFVRAPLVSNEALFAYLGQPAFCKADWLRTAHPRREHEQTPFDPFTLSPQASPTLEMEQERVKGERSESVKVRVKGAKEEAILIAMDELEEEERPLTLNAIAKRAKLTWHQYDQIEEVADYYGYALARGTGRPGKEGS